MAGPGAGKSTLRAGVFFKLKTLGIDCEEATEYAKDKVWEGSSKVLENQIYIFGKQQHRIFRLKKKVEAVITDSPLLLSIIYNKKGDMAFNDLVLQEFGKYDNLNFFIKRRDDYNPNGRNQTKEDAEKIDQAILDLMDSNQIPYHIVDASDKEIPKIVKMIQGRLEELSAEES